MFTKVSLIFNLYCYLNYFIDLKKIILINISKWHTFDLILVLHREVKICFYLSVYCESKQNEKLQTLTELLKEKLKV